MKIAEAFVEIRPQTDKFKAETDKAARDAGDSMERELTDAGKRTAVSLGEVLAAGAFTAFVVKATKSAADLEQAVGGTAAVFKEHSMELDRFAESAADNVGLSEKAARELTSTLGGALKGYGFSVDEAADKSIQLTKLGADLAATYGGDTKDAVMALSAALRGEFDPLERYSIAINQTLIDQKAVSLGLASSTSNVDQHARAQAALALITERSADAQGQFGREADTASGQAERAAAKMENASADLGKNFLPVYTKISEVVGGVASAFGSLPGPVQTAVVALAGIAALKGPVGSAFDTVRGLATGMSQAFDKAAISAYDLAGTKGLGRMAADGVLAAGAIAGLTYSIGKWNDQMAQAEQRSGDIVKGLQQRQLTDSFEQQVDRLRRVQEQVANLKKSSDEIGAFDFAGAAELPQLNQLEDALGRQAMAMQVNVAAAKALAEARNISVDAAYKEIVAGSKTEAAADKEKQSRDKLTDALGKEKDARQKISDERNKEVDAIIGLGDAAAGYDAAQRDVTAAALKLQQAQTPADRAAAQDELTAALRRQADARLKVAETQAQANGTELTAAQRATIYADELRKLTDRFPGLRAQMLPTIALLDEMAKPRQAEIDVKVNGLAEAYDQLLVFATFQKLVRGEYDNDLVIKAAAKKMMADVGVALPPGMAQGGPVRAGRPYTVGEHGKEVFVPEVDGSIIPDPPGSLDREMANLGEQVGRALADGIRRGLGELGADGQPVDNKVWAPPAYQGEIRQFEDGSWGVMRTDASGRTYNDVAAAKQLPQNRGLTAATVNIYGHDWSLAEAGREFSTRVGELVGGGQR